LTSTWRVNTYTVVANIILNVDRPSGLECAVLQWVQTQLRGDW